MCLDRRRGDTDMGGVHGDSMAVPFPGIAQLFPWHRGVSGDTRRNLSGRGDDVGRRMKEFVEQGGRGERSGRSGGGRECADGRKGESCHVGCLGALPGMRGSSSGTPRPLNHSGQSPPGPLIRPITPVSGRMEQAHPHQIPQPREGTPLWRCPQGPHGLRGSRGVPALRGAGNGAGSGCVGRQSGISRGARRPIGANDNNNHHHIYMEPNGSEQLPESIWRQPLAFPHSQRGAGAEWPRKLIVIQPQSTPGEPRSGAVPHDPMMVEVGWRGRVGEGMEGKAWKRRIRGEGMEGMQEKGWRREGGEGMEGKG